MCTVIFRHICEDDNFFKLIYRQNYGIARQSIISYAILMIKSPYFKTLFFMKKFSFHYLQKLKRLSDVSRNYGCISNDLLDARCNYILSLINRKAEYTFFPTERHYLLTTTLLHNTKISPALTKNNIKKRSKVNSYTVSLVQSWPNLRQITAPSLSYSFIFFSYHDMNIVTADACQAKPAFTDVL